MKSFGVHELLPSWIGILCIDGFQFSSPARVVFSHRPLIPVTGTWCFPSVLSYREGQSRMSTSHSVCTTFHIFMPCHRNLSFMFTIWILNIHSSILVTHCMFDNKYRYIILQADPLFFQITKIIRHYLQHAKTRCLPVGMSIHDYFHQLWNHWNLCIKNKFDIILLY